jgi:hypothetical protein
MNWPLPPAEEQHSNVADSFGCVSFAAVHCIESQEIAQTGQTPGYSERALAKLSGTVYTGPVNKRGNNAENVYNAILKYGLILDSDWPTELGDDWTLDEFYADIPPEILVKANKPNITLLNGSTNFSLAPVWTAMLIGGTMGHMVEQLDQVDYFDSYVQYQKQFNSSDQITWQGQLILNPQSKRMLVFFQVPGTQTKWALMDGAWVGFSDMTAFNNYVSGRPFVTINIGQSEFIKLKANADVFKS